MVVTFKNFVFVLKKNYRHSINKGITFSSYNLTSSNGDGSNMHE